MASQVTIAGVDIEHLCVIRKNVSRFMKRMAERYAKDTSLLLDIAPQIHEGARPYFASYVTIETFDIDPTSGCTYIGDICKFNQQIPSNRYDFVVCTEVLEHTLRPFDAVTEIHRLLKPGGYLFLSVPFNFRIHGPLPDCWRFTEHGLRSLLSQYDLVELTELPTPGRALMPIHYTAVAQKTLEYK